jgi:hypothetical protein
MQKIVKIGDVVIVKSYIKVKSDDGFHKGMRIRVESINNATGNIIGYRLKPEGIQISNKNKKEELVLTHQKEILGYA